MDRITNPITIQPPALITPRAPHYNEEERKRHQEERRRHEEEEEKENRDGVETTLPDEDSSIGSKIDIQI